MNAEKQDLFNSLSQALNITPTQGEMDDFLYELNKNGLKLVEKCCEPFQPCEKCKPKTEWLPLSKMKVGVEYWLLDKNFMIGKGYLRNDIMIDYVLKDCPQNFGSAVMFTEIKPPEPPNK